MVNRSDYTPAQNELLRRMGVPDNDEPTAVQEIVITEDDIPDSMRGSFVRNVVNREAGVSFKLDGVGVSIGDSLGTEIRSRNLRTRDEVLALMREFAA